jgi:hypothetical protein
MCSSRSIARRWCRRLIPWATGGGNEFLYKLRTSRGKTTNEKLHSYWDGGIEDFPPMGPNFAPPPLPFHVMKHLGEALDEVRKGEYGRLKGQSRAYTKGQKYTLLSHRENLTLMGRQAISTWGPTPLRSGRAVKIR